MSKFGWSLPPGVTTLPGESAEDRRAEEMAECIMEALEPALYYARELVQQHDGTELGMNLDAALAKAEDKACLNIMKLIDKAYSTGYADGIQDEQWATVNTEKMPKEGGNE